MLRNAVKYPVPKVHLSVLQAATTKIACVWRATSAKVCSASRRPCRPAPRPWLFCPPFNTLVGREGYDFGQLSLADRSNSLPTRTVTVRSDRKKPEERCTVPIERAVR